MSAAPNSNSHHTNQVGACKTTNQDNKNDIDEPSYHHYSLIFDENFVSSKFADVRVVLVAGCVFRAEKQAEYLATNLDIEGTKYNLECLTKPTSRFTLFKVGPVLISNHGMGAASMSIALHELFLMCRRAGVLDRITMIRFGTCGGIGVAPGTICITNKAYDSIFQDFVELKICQRIVRRDCVMDQKTAGLIERLAKDPANKRDFLGEFQVSSGATVATNDFYEEQGRTTGAICEHTQADKRAFLERASQLGVINMEMESNYMAAMCHKLNVSFGVLCVALTNRLITDKAHVDRSQMDLFETRLFWLNLLIVRHKMNADKKGSL